MSGIRLQPGRPRHYGGSNRTIIKQAYEMLVSDRTALAKKPIGTLVTLDKVFELVEGNLSNEKRTDIHDIAERFKNDAEDHGWALRVAKAICLLEFIRDLPRTEANLAAFLVDEVGKPRPAGAGARRRSSGCTPPSSSATPRRAGSSRPPRRRTGRPSGEGYLEPKPRERNEITRQRLARRSSTSRSSRPTATRTSAPSASASSVDGTQLGDEGDLPLTLCVADDADDLTRSIDEVRDGEPPEVARERPLLGLRPDARDRRAGRPASRLTQDGREVRPTARPEQDHVRRGHLPSGREERRARLPEPPAGQAHRGDGAGHRHVPGRARRMPRPWARRSARSSRSSSATSSPTSTRSCEMGSRPAEGDEAEQFLKAADLKALPSVFYDGRAGARAGHQGRAEVRRRTPTADVAKEVLDYLKSEHSYGNKESRMGKALEKRFGGIGYGWERDMLRLVLAVLFRAG